MCPDQQLKVVNMAQWQRSISSSEFSYQASFLLFRRLCPRPVGLGWGYQSQSKLQRRHDDKEVSSLPLYYLYLPHPDDMGHDTSSQ